MSIKTFIDRPVTSVMMAVLMVILGVIALIALPVSQYPDIAPPTVKVSATYTGASAETVIYADRTGDADRNVGQDGHLAD